MDLLIHITIKRPFDSSLWLLFLVRYFACSVKSRRKKTHTNVFFLHYITFSYVFIDHLCFSGQIQKHSVHLNSCWRYSPPYTGLLLRCVANNVLQEAFFVWYARTLKPMRWDGLCALCIKRKHLNSTEIILQRILGRSGKNCNSCWRMSSRKI